MTQTSIFVKLMFQPGKRDEGIAALEKMLPVVADEPGTLVYSFHLDASDENTLWIFELYSDGDALAAHGGSEGMKDVMKAFGELTAEPPLFVMATPTPGGNKGLPS